MGFTSVEQMYVVEGALRLEVSYEGFVIMVGTDFIRQQASGYETPNQFASVCRDRDGRRARALERYFGWEQGL
jgi:hypothetical protein